MLWIMVCICKSVSGLAYMQGLLLKIIGSDNLAKKQTKTS